MTAPVWTFIAAALAAGSAACGGPPPRPTLTFAGSAVGREAEILRTQLARFEGLQKSLEVEVRATPDAAGERRQLYVQWLNAHAADPDVLQLDVIWVPEFAAAGWLRPLDRYQPDIAGFFPATIEANRWNGRLFAVPWFVDVGMLYWRTDLMESAPRTFAELTAAARAQDAAPFGFVWQGARYEGLVTVFLEHLGGFGGRMFDDEREVAVDSDAAVRALTFMRDSIWSTGIVPPAVLTWQEEQARFAFQNGQAALMRNWPYAHPLLAGDGSRVAGRFAIAAMPASPEGRPTAALGGSQLGVNAFSDHPDAAYALVAFLTAPDQMLERARVAGQLPPRPSLYEPGALDDALGFNGAAAREIIARAVPRPVTPVYSELSDILQVHLHRALTRQNDPRTALVEAAARMRRVLARAGLSRAASSAP